MPNWLFVICCYLLFLVPAVASGGCGGCVCMAIPRNKGHAKPVALMRCACCLWACQITCHMSHGIRSQAVMSGR
jgi:hypothetical protein